MNSTDRIELSQVISALSYALDITEGQPEGHAMRSCLIAMRVAAEVGLDAGERSDLFYATLLKDLGCSSNAAKTCKLFGADDLQIKRNLKTVDWSDQWKMFLFVKGNVVPDGTPVRRAMQVVSVAFAVGEAKEAFQTRCERGADIAGMIGLSEATSAAIRTLDEHWDGHGEPSGLRGEDIPLLGRIVGLAQTAEVFFSTYGPDAAFTVAEERGGRWFDPELVAAFGATRGDAAFWSGLTDGDLPAQVAAVEPRDRVLTADGATLDRVAQGFAQVIDAKSPYTYRHSEGVAEIAVAIGAALGFSDGDLRDLRRAGLLHDIGKLGVSNTILDKPGKLTDDEMASVRKHPEYTQRILDRVDCFRELAETAAAHHERIDGNGYHRGIPAGDLPVAARVLAVADIFEALSAERPYRAALPLERVLEIMRGMVGPGICPECFEALGPFLERSEPPLALCA